MKIRITVPGILTPYNEYIPIFPATQSSSVYDECIPINIYSIKYMIPNNTCEFIYLGDRLDYISNREQILQSIVQKLKPNGELIIDGNDLNSIIHQSSKDITKIQYYLYNGKQSVSSLLEMKKLLKTYGLAIIFSKLFHLSYTIIAKKPLPKDSK